MELMYYYITMFIVSLCATWWIFKKVLKIARLKNIMDAPGERKLHQVPVPVMGGIAVFFGMVVAFAVAGIVYDMSDMFAMMCVMTLMLYVGCMDDIIGLSSTFRFIVEVLVIVFLIYCNGYSIDNFHGLWGVYEVSQWIAVPLTVFACVGIINSINLIDGVNGLSSGYCIVTCLIFGTVAFMADDFNGTSLAVICVGALIPFFIHNVFGKESKMFIGDGGTLLMGSVISAFVINALRTDSSLASCVPDNFGLIPFTLAVLALPVFDTLRVMMVRIFSGHSPFRPDRTHLHHLLIDLHFSHLSTTMIEIMANLLIILGWYISYILGASIDIQLYVVIFLGVMMTAVFYWSASRWKSKNNRIYNMMTKAGDWSNERRFKWLDKLTGILDRNC